jgi:adenosine deaminase
MNNASLKSFIEGLPKAELHVHLEGTLEPDMLFYLAKRNHVQIAQNSVEALREAYDFHDLQHFLDIYFQGASVLKTEEDFYDLTLAYLMQMYDENVVRVELMFDPQTHLVRGVSLETQITGMHRAITYAKNEYGISVQLIMCFLRHLSEEDALSVFTESKPFHHLIMAVGLDSTEVNRHPPDKFRHLFQKARHAGFRVVAHAGEEGPCEYIAQALTVLGVERIDHGIKCLEDPDLTRRLVNEQIPLTTCPLSNIKLNVLSSIDDFPLRQMLDANLLVTINSDDPAYFGGYLSQNYLAVAEAANLTRQDLRLLAKNSIQASFASVEEKIKWLAMVDDYCDNYTEEPSTSLLVPRE